MKALLIKSYEGEHRAAVENVPSPTPEPDEVLVRVAAAAVNPLDTKLARGYLKDFFPLKFPYVLGTDLAGTIEAVGARVTGFRVGEAVLARTETLRGGAFAERAVVPVRLLTRLPRQLTIEEGAGLVTVAATAWQTLFEVARITPSTRLLVTGGAGSVGGMAVRLAASVGARVFATTRARDLSVAEKYGAVNVFDSEAKPDLKDLDLVYDTVGGDAHKALFSLLREGGTLAAIASPPDAEAGRGRKIDARFVFHEADGSRLALAANYCAARDIKPVIDRMMKLDAAREAVALVASGQARGKIILTP